MLSFLVILAIIFLSLLLFYKKPLLILFEFSNFPPVHLTYAAKEDKKNNQTNVGVFKQNPYIYKKNPKPSLHNWRDVL